ncbi:MAG: hypothetical protein V1746_01000 [bacterium]
MSTLEMAQELKAMPHPAREEALKAILQELYPSNVQAVSRILRRLQNPDIPEDFWEAIEEAKDGKVIEMKDEHFDQPPV